MLLVSFQDIQKEGENRLVLVELSKVLVEVAKRQWPQYWETFISDIRESHSWGVSPCNSFKVSLGVGWGWGDSGSNGLHFFPPSFRCVS